MTKHVTSGGIHLRGLASGQHSSEETTQRWRTVHNTMPDLTGIGIEPQTSRTDSDVFNHNANWEVKVHLNNTEGFYLFTFSKCLVYFESSQEEQLNRLSKPQEHKYNNE